jgi:hypothetical protein
MPQSTTAMPVVQWGRSLNSKTTRGSRLAHLCAPPSVVQLQMLAADSGFARLLILREDHDRQRARIGQSPGPKQVGSGAVTRT